MLIINHHKTATGKIIAEATLSAEKSLNALNEKMARALLSAVDEWQNDDAVAAALINGAGERAFCAGGDVREIYAAVKAGDADAAGRYFAAEYETDFALHCFSKPLICWAGGIVMGGGAGIMQGCNLRAATETTKMAMPETAIGALPDVGAAYFLRGISGGGGFFLGASGAPVNGEEARALGLADTVIAAAARPQLLDSLLAAKWRGDANDDIKTAREVLRELARKNPPPQMQTPMLRAQKTIAKIQTAEDALAIPPNCDFTKRAAKRLQSASPSSLALWQRHFHSLQNATLAEVFAAEYSAMCATVAMGDFCEGVRALLIEKDNAPKWMHNSPATVPQEWLRAAAEYDNKNAKVLTQTLTLRAPAKHN